MELAGSQLNRYRYTNRGMHNAPIARSKSPTRIIYTFLIKLKFLDLVSDPARGQ